MTIDRAQAVAPALQQEEVPVDSLGGTVIVRGLMLSDRLEMYAEELPAEGETKEAAAKRAAASLVERQLARAVVLADGKPLWTAEQWKGFGQRHSEDAFRLYNLSNSFSGGDTKGIEKN